MNFLQFLGLKKAMDDTDPKNVVKLPVDYIKPTLISKPKEYYRVGVTTDGGTTLTLMGDNGTSMTLTMTREYCEQLIRMLESTFEDDDESE
jgi:hypothetical protein